MTERTLLEERILETYRSMLSLNASAIKAIFLLNGGAAVALLAFVGDVWGPDGPKHVHYIFISMIAFMCGLLFALLATLAAYAAQFTLYFSDLDAAGGEKSVYRSSRMWSSSKKMHAATLLLVAIGFVFFALGCLLAAFAVSPLAP